MKKEVYLRSTDRKNQLHIIIWEPDGDIKAMMQISHGMIEYVEANVIKLFKGERYCSKLLKKMAFGSYNKHITAARTENDWLSRNAENVEKYNRDKYCTFLFTVNGYQTLFDVLKYIQKAENIRKIPKKLPLYFIAGKEDPVGNYGEGVLKIAEQYKENDIKNIQTKLYENDRHEIINETDKEIVFNDIFHFAVYWLNRN